MEALYRAVIERRYAKPGRVIVDMNDSALVQEGIHQNTEIFTPGINGCYVVALHGTNEAGRFAVLTHYQPNHLTENARALQRVAQDLSDHGRILTASCRLYASYFDARDFAGMPSMFFEIDHKETHFLTAIVKVTFGRAADVQVVPYLAVLRSTGQDRTVAVRSVLPSGVTDHFETSLVPQK